MIAFCIYFDCVIVVLGTILYHLYNLENVKNTHRRVLLLAKLNALACNST